MDIRHLQAFVQIAIEGHFGRAAEHLHVTQPALTQRVQALEREVGVQLFKRSPREVRLTPAGEVLLPYAQSLVQIQGQALRELEEIAAGRGGCIRLGYQGHGDMNTQVRIATEFRRRHPRVRVSTSAASSQENMLRVASGDLDAAFVAAPVQPIQGVIVRPITKYALVLAMPKSHRLAEMDRVPVRQLRSEKLNLFPSHMNPGSIAAFRSWLVRHTGASLNVVSEEPPDQAMEAVSAYGGPIAFISSVVANAMSLPGVVFRPMSPAPLMTLSLAYLRNNPAPILASLLRTIDEVAAGYQEELPQDGEVLLESEPAEPRLVPNRS
jgi:DNA-binding transcriptional LysR family regulator